MINQDHGLPELCQIPPCRQDHDYANSREATRTSGNRLPAQIIFSNRTHLLQIILCNTHTSLCILDRNLHLRIARLMMPLWGNAAENKKILTYAPAQDHYGDCIQGLIFSLPTRSAAEVESMMIGGADPRS